MVTLHRKKLAALCVGFHVFGNHVDPEAAAYGEDRFDDDAPRAFPRVWSTEDYFPRRMKMA